LLREHKPGTAGVGLLETGVCTRVAQVFLQLWAKSLAGPGVYSQHAAYLGHSTGTERKRGIQIGIILCHQLSRPNATQA